MFLLRLLGPLFSSSSSAEMKIRGTLAPCLPEGESRTMLSEKSNESLFLFERLSATSIHMIKIVYTSGRGLLLGKSAAYHGLACSVPARQRFSFVVLATANVVEVL